MKQRYLKIGLISISLLFLVNCGGGDSDSSSDNPSSDTSSQRDSVTIAGTTIPLTLNTEDEILSQKVIEWNDGETFSYLENNKKVMTYSLAYGNYSSRSDMDGYWDVRDDSNELWVLFKDGELSRFEVTTDGNGYIQYITQVNSDARPTHLVGEPSPLLLEQVAQDTVEDNQVEDVIKESVTSEDLFGEWAIASTNMYDQEIGNVYVFTSSSSFYNGKMRAYKLRGNVFVEDQITEITWYLESDGKTIPLMLWTVGEEYYWGITWTVQSLNMTSGELTLTEKFDAFEGTSTRVLHKCGSPSANVEPLKQLCD